jgi:polysaccharide biosynthesis protein PslH
MKSLRILLVMLEAPTPFGNAAARWYYVLLKGLVARGHRVTAFAACSNSKEIAKAKELFPSPEYDLRMFPFPVRSGIGAKLATLLKPYSYMFSPELIADLEAERAKGYDLLHLEQLWCGWLVEKHSEKTFLNVHFFGSIDLEGNLSSWRQRLEYFLLCRAEKKLLRALLNFGVLSDRMAEVLRTKSSSKVMVTRLGLETNHYKFREVQNANDPPIIGLIGSMNWFPSSSAALRLLNQLLPRIQQEIPNIRVLIVGWHARSALKDFIDATNIEILENVPDAEPYFNMLNVLVYAPIRGTGVKVKVQEAFALGIPVVTTTEGVEGLAAQDGVHAGICDDDEGLAQRVVELLRNPVKLEAQRRAARAMLEEHCGPEASLNVLEQCYAQLLSENN